MKRALPQPAVSTGNASCCAPLPPTAISRHQLLNICLISVAVNNTNDKFGSAEKAMLVTASAPLSSQQQYLQRNSELPTISSHQTGRWLPHPLPHNLHPQGVVGHEGGGSAASAGDGVGEGGDAVPVLRRHNREMFDLGVCVNSFSPCAAAAAAAIFFTLLQVSKVEHAMQRLEELLLRSRSVQVQARACLQYSSCFSLTRYSLTPMAPVFVGSERRCCVSHVSCVHWQLLSRGHNPVVCVARSVGCVQVLKGSLALVIGMTRLSYELLIYIHTYTFVYIHTCKMFYF
jgi:hypothetical protein